MLIEVWQGLMTRMSRETWSKSSIEGAVLVLGSRSFEPFLKVSDMFNNSPCSVVATSRQGWAEA